MPREVVTERFLLEPEQLVLRPFRYVRRRGLVGHAAAGSVAEEPALAAFAVALTLLPVLDGGVAQRHELRPLPAEGVEGARLDEAFEHPLVDRARIDLTCEVEQAPEPPVLL